MPKSVALIIILTVSVSTFAAKVATTTPTALISPDSNLGGVTSSYTAKMPRFLNQTLNQNTDKLLELAAEKPAPISLQCIRDPHDKYYIGLKQTMFVKSSLDKVGAVLDDINDYNHLFPGYKDVRIIGREGDKIFTSWEQIVPVPFVPNIRYEVTYRIQNLSKTDRLYQYQLRKKSTLTASDGFILIRSLKPDLTAYTEYDFFNADWGAAKIFGANKIWHDSVEGLALSDLATKLRAENQTWSNQKARREAKKLLDSNVIKTCLQNRVTIKSESNLTGDLNSTK